MGVELDRRKFLKLGMAAAAGTAATSVVPRALAQACGPLTPKQTPGPFYPGEQNFHPDNNLTAIQGHAKRALGQIIYVAGTVADQNCKPIPGAAVEIWQACASGKYNNPKDPNPAPLDPNFKYWGEAFTDQNGRYIFKTIIPGAYPADTNWIRPPHIHFKVAKLGYVELVTQMYFKGDKYNDADLILREIPANLRSTVIVDFVSSPSNMEPGSLTGVFNITLKSVR